MTIKESCWMKYLSQELIFAAGYFFIHTWCSRPSSTCHCPIASHDKGDASCHPHPGFYQSVSWDDFYFIFFHWASSTSSLTTQQIPSLFSPVHSSPLSNPWAGAFLLLLWLPWAKFRLAYSNMFVILSWSHYFASWIMASSGTPCFIYSSGEKNK